MVRSSRRIEDALIFQQTGGAAPQHGNCALREIADRLRPHVLLGAPVAEIAFIGTS